MKNELVGGFTPTQLKFVVGAGALFLASVKSLQIHSLLQLFPNESLIKILTLTSILFPI
jgi:hypothetical protein